MSLQLFLRQEITFFEIWWLFTCNINVCRKRLTIPTSLSFILIFTYVNSCCILFLFSRSVIYYCKPCSNQLITAHLLNSILPFEFDLPTYPSVVARVWEVVFSLTRINKNNRINRLTTKLVKTTRYICCPLQWSKTFTFVGPF